MSSSFAPTQEQAAAPAAPPPCSPALVTEMLGLLGKAMRAHQLYLPNNPMYQRAMEMVRGSFAPIWSATDQIRLSVAETEFGWEGSVVFSESSKSDSLPWLFFKDGIRELTILRGFETDEVVRLLEIVQRVKKASPEEDDLITLLWMQDFLHLRYQFVDLTSEATTPLEASMVTERPTVAPQEVMDETAEARAGIVRMDDFDSTLYFLDEHEIEYLRSQVQSEYAADLRRNVLSVLLDIFELQPVTTVREEIAGILDNFMMHLLSAGDFRSVAFLLREAALTIQRARELDPPLRQRFQTLPDRLSSPEALSQVLQSLDEASNLPAQEELNELFEQLRPVALATVFGWLGKLQNVKVRMALETAAGRLAAANTSELVRLILDTDSTIAVEAIRRAGQLKAQAAVGSLGKVSGSPAVGIRLAAVQALADIGSAGALQLLERSVDDESRDVRVLAVRVLGARGHRAALPKVEAAVKGKAIRAADLTEKMAFFETYGSLAAVAGIGALDAMLNGKGFLGKREDAEIRACAAMALGKIGTPEALDALRRAASEKDVLVRNAVNRALRGGAS